MEAHGQSEGILRQLLTELQEMSATIRTLLSTPVPIIWLSVFMIAFPPGIFLAELANAHLLLSPSLLFMFVAGLFGLRLSLQLED